MYFIYYIHEKQSIENFITKIYYQYILLFIFVILQEFLVL